jgi:tetratricopeptide (TPR) repeat protein
MGANSVFAGGRFAGGRKVANLARTLAVATALTSVAVAGTADAQNRRDRERQQERAPQAEYSEAFVTAYNAVQAVTQSGATEFSAARPLVPAMVAAAVSGDEKNAAGNMMLQVGQNLRDVPLQRQGIEMMLASGKIPPENQGQYYYYVGNFALQAREFAAGRAALQRAVDLGFSPAQAATDPAVDPRTQILQSLFLEQNFPTLIQTAEGLLTAANGANVPELWLTYGLQGAIETQNAEAAATFSAPLVQHYPTPRNVRNAVRVALSQAGVRNGPIMADAMRLLYEANAMTAEADVAAYVGSLDPRLMANEVLRVLERSSSTNVIPASDGFHTENFAVATERSASERRDAPTLLRDAQSAATGLEAYEAGEIYMSLGDYAQAETLYELALTKGSQDRDRDLMRQAIAEYRGGKKAEASATFAQVGGTRARLAALWQAFIASQG